MIAAPETLRSAGTPPKPIPARRVAWATYEVLRHGEACVQITYLGDDGLWSGLRVQVRNPRLGAYGEDPLYERAYVLACFAAGAHGYEIERFTRAGKAVR